jgi:acetyl-CoA carboxylase biotin carboxyl carrier protein
LTPEPTTEPTSQAVILAEVCQHAARLLSGLDAQPRSLRVQVGDVAVDIEWPEPQPNGAHPRPVDAATTEAATAVPDAGGRDARRPVLAAQAVGVFYRCPEPGADPFVREGDAVTAGQQIAIIEAMKLMLPVEAERAGRIVEVLKGDGEPVEYGEPLFALAEAE